MSCTPVAQSPTQLGKATLSGELSSSSYMGAMRIDFTPNLEQTTK